jgi:hypothetical protein
VAQRAPAAAWPPVPLYHTGGQEMNMRCYHGIYPL